VFSTKCYKIKALRYIALHASIVMRKTSSSSVVTAIH